MHILWPRSLLRRCAQPSAMDSKIGSGKIPSSLFPRHRRWPPQRLGQGLLMRTSSLSTCSTARWICAVLVTSRIMGVTRLSECCSGPRVSAYALRAPRLSASSKSSRPMPRLAPVIKIVLFSMFILSAGFVNFVLLFLLQLSWQPATPGSSESNFLEGAHASADLHAESLGPAAHTTKRSDDFFSG